jgi:hypothetical protein
VPAVNEAPPWQIDGATEFGEYAVEENAEVDAKS